jgi:hypothetical protein
VRSWPAGGLRLVLPDERSQLKEKPNEAAPVNPAVGGSCPPPWAVHAVSTATRTTVAAHQKDRRTTGDALAFTGKPVLVGDVRWVASSVAIVERIVSRHASPLTALRDPYRFEDIPGHGDVQIVNTRTIRLDPRPGSFSNTRAAHRSHFRFALRLASEVDCHIAYEERELEFRPFS